MSASGRVSRFQQLIGHSGQRTDHDHRLRAESAPHDTDEPADRGGILYRRAAELHHHQLIASLESALPRSSGSLFADMFAHMSSSVSQFWGKEKPTARSLLAVGSGDSLKIALLHPIPSSRRHVIRVDMPVLVDVTRFAVWTRMLMKSRTANCT
jgi:hypothetical protein